MTRILIIEDQPLPRAADALATDAGAWTWDVLSLVGSTVVGLSP